MFEFNWPAIQRSILPFLLAFVLLVGAEYIQVFHFHHHLSLSAYFVFSAFILVGFGLGYYFKRQAESQSVIANIVLITIVLFWTGHYVYRHLLFSPTQNLRVMLYYDVLISFLLILSASVFDFKQKWTQLKQMLRALLNK